MPCPGRARPGLPGAHRAGALPAVHSVGAHRPRLPPTPTPGTPRARHHDDRRRRPERRDLRRPAVHRARRPQRPPEPRVGRDGLRLAARRARRLDERRARRRRPAARDLQPVARAGQDPAAPDLRAVQPGRRQAARALPVRDRLRRLERGEPRRSAELQAPRRRRRLLQDPQDEVPDLQRAAGVAARQPEPRAVDAAAAQGDPQAGTARAARLGPAQLLRRQPAEGHLDARAAGRGQGQGVDHRVRWRRLRDQPDGVEVPAGRGLRRQGGEVHPGPADPGQPAHRARVLLQLEAGRHLAQLGLRPRLGARPAASRLPGDQERACAAASCATSRSPRRS